MMKKSPRKSTGIGESPQVYSLAAYRSLIELALAEGYAFLPFEQTSASGGRSIYLRHDVDYSLSAALEIAAINCELGITGTFFLRLRSELYNLFSPYSIQCAERIRDSGQVLALHVDVSEKTPCDSTSLAEHVRDEFLKVEQAISGIHPVFAWHNPTEELIEAGSYMDVQGMIHCYAPRFVREQPYLSDSNQRYTVDELRALLARNRAPSMTLLLHPVLWTSGGSDMFAVLANMWRRLIRDSERGMMENAVYQHTFPNGMPDNVLQKFSENWIDATK